MDRLYRWIRLNVPEAGDPAKVYLKSCARIPFWWIPGNRHIAGLTLWRTIYVTEAFWPINPSKRESVEFLLHEFIHVAQFHRHPLFFPLKYLIDHVLYGYWNNPAEVEARERAAELVDAYFADLSGKS
jgi:hypothetical protein